VAETNPIRLLASDSVEECESRMNMLQALVLGLLQGATEFIPVSSSGHLTLVPWLLHWEFEPVLKNAFDVMAHWGTLVAIAGVFWRDLWHLALGGLRTLGGLRKGGIQGVVARAAADEHGRLAWLIVIGSVPAAVLGLLLESFFERLFGEPRTVSLLLIATAGLLTFSEWRGRKGRDLPGLGWLDALWIGLGQAMAIAPGISRSGATIASGLLRGVKLSIEHAGDPRRGPVAAQGSVQQRGLGGAGRADGGGVSGIGRGRLCVHTLPARLPASRAAVPVCGLLCDRRDRLPGHFICPMSTS
jgi:undecaprenyl-diphosphatase UppP